MTQLMEPPTTQHPTERPLSLLSVPVLDDHLRPFGRRDTSLRRKMVPAVAIAVIVMAYIYATTPFTFAGAVECRPSGIAGVATPAPGTPAGIIVGDVRKRCAEAGASRLATAGATALLVGVVGVAGAIAPSRDELEARRHGSTGDGDGDQLTGDSQRTATT